MFYRKFALFILFSSLLAAQSIDTSKVATVHVYRQGRLLIAVSVFADGNRVIALTPHKSATFYLIPGYHELTMQSGEVSPAASFKAVARQRIFLSVGLRARRFRHLAERLERDPEHAANNHGR